MELSVWENQAISLVGSACWSKKSLSQQRYYISGLVRKKFQDEHREALLQLEMQGAAHEKVIEDCQEFDWMRQLTGLSTSLLKFGINSVTNTLPTVDNLRRWGYLRVGEETCSLCGDPNPTITHVLSMCKVALLTDSTEFNGDMIMFSENLLILSALTCSLKTSEFLLIWKVISTSMGFSQKS